MPYVDLPFKSTAAALERMERLEWLKIETVDARGLSRTV